MEMNKKEFIERFLEPLLINSEYNIKNVKYVDLDHTEIVLITYIGGARRYANVTCNSLMWINKATIETITSGGYDYLSSNLQLEKWGL